MLPQRRALSTGRLGATTSGNSWVAQLRCPLDCLPILVGCHTLYDMATKRSSRVLTVSVPPDTADMFEAIASGEGRNKSELFREMLRVYEAFRETRTFESLQRYGAAEASRAGIRTEKDVERLIREARA